MNLPGRVLVLGLWTGWIAALLFGRIVPIRFAVTPPPDGIFSGLALTGYAKSQDWFRYALGLLSGPLGAACAALAWRSLRRRRVRCLRRGIGAGAACAALATLCAFMNADAGPAVALLLLPAAAVLPWLDSRWYEAADSDAPKAPAVPGIRPVRDLPLLGLGSCLWVFDSCVLFRSVDGFHEGTKLLYLQAFLAGDLPGADVRLEYGPLAVHALWWWAAAFGATLESYRWWFLALQAAGLTLTLAALRRRAPAAPVFAGAAAAILTLSSVGGVQYGIPNALRIGLPVAALAWGNRPAVSGVLLAAAFLFSPEYGAAAGLAWVAAAALDRRPIRAWADCSAAAVATAVALIAVMFGGRWTEGVAGLFAGSHGAARLFGAGVMAMPEFPWVGPSRGWLRDAEELATIITLWGPGLTAAGALAWIALRRESRAGAEVAGGAVFVLLASVPVIARPAGQQANLVPPAAILAALLAGQGIESGGAARRAGWAGVALLAGLAVVQLPRTGGPLAAKAWLCTASLREPALPPSGLERLGRVRPDGAALAGLHRAVTAIRRWCPAGGRVYLAAPRYAHLPFLADRAALAPWPLVSLSATAADRAEIMTALERIRPAVALVTADGLDVPWAVEHAEARAAILRDYVKCETIGDLEVWTRRP